MLQGTLLKRRDHLPGWRPRHFVVQGPPDYLLLYYLPSHSQPNAPPRGLLPLGGASVRALSEEEAGGVRHAFRVDHPWAAGVSRSKGWVLAARSRQEREKWVRVLKGGIGEAEAALRREEDKGGQEEGKGLERAMAGGGAGGGGSGEAAAAGDAALVVPLDQLVLPGYEEATERSVRTLLEFAEPSDGWRLNFERRGVRAYKRANDKEDEGGQQQQRRGPAASVPIGSFTTLKGQGIIRHHPISVLLAVMDNTIGREIDPQFDYGRRVRIHNQHNFLDYLKYKGIFPVAARDMYIMCHWRVLEDQDGAIVITVWSDTGNPHPEEKGIVRAEVLTAGWVIRPLDPPHCTASSCTYFSQADLKGFIPKAIVDIATDPQPMLIHTVACALDKDTTGRFKVNRHRFTGGGKGIGRYTARDVVPYIARIHRHNLPDGGRSGEYPWLLEALQQEQDAAEAEGGDAASYETAEERRRQQLLRQQAFHQEVVARLEREARARSLKEEVQSRAWLGCCALGLALLLLSFVLALNPAPSSHSSPSSSSSPPVAAAAAMGRGVTTRVCEWLGDSWLNRLGVTSHPSQEGEEDGVWGPPEQPLVRPEKNGEGAGGAARRQRRKKKQQRSESGPGLGMSMSMPRGEGPMPPLIA